MSKEFRVGIVGPVSAFSLYFAEALVAAPDVSFGGLATLGRSSKYVSEAWYLPYLREYPQTLDAYAAAYGARLYEQPEDMIAAERLDAVCITTEDYLRHHHALRAVAQGCHVFSPKPFAMNRAEALAMFAAGRQKGVVVMGSLPLRFNPAYVQAAGLIADGAIGDPISGHFTIHHHLTLGGWKSDPSMAGGPDLEMGFYTFDAMRMLMRSEPSEVWAMADNLDHRGIPYIDSAACLVRFHSRAIVTADLRFSMHHRFGGHAAFEVVGNAGAMAYGLDPATNCEVLSVHTRSGVTRHEVPYSTGYKGEEMLHWARLCRDGGNPAPWQGEALRTIEFIEAFTQAHQTGGPVVLPAEPPSLEEALASAEVAEPERFIVAG